MAMKNWVLRILVALLGLLFLGLGVQFLLTPESAAVGFGLAAMGDTGVSTLRADIGAMFFGFAFFALVPLILKRPEWLKVAALLLGIALVTRLFGVVMTGAINPEIIRSLVIEAVSVIIFWLGSVHLPKRVAN